MHLCDPTMNILRKEGIHDSDMRCKSIQGVSYLEVFSRGRLKNLSLFFKRSDITTILFDMSITAYQENKNQSDWQFGIYQMERQQPVLQSR